MRITLFPVLVCAIAFAQTPDSQIAFEVATIKPSGPPGMGRMRIGNQGGPGTPDPGRFTCDRCNLSMLVSTAYNLNYVQISGPSWLAEAQFDLTAKVPEGATEAQLRVMIQNLLIERFKLAAHREKKDAPVYELTVAKSGPKLKTSTGEADPPDSTGRGGFRPPPPSRARDADGFPQFPPGRRSMMVMMPGRARWRLVDESMAQFSKSLQGMVGRPVNDATGLTGKYDFELSFSPAAGGLTMGRGMLPGPLPPPSGVGTGGPEGPAASTPDDSAPSIFTAIQDQLGLRLESKKGPVEMLVIDHAEKVPTEN
jgi:uncharacterized protein (TIGR03435 family)